MNKLLVALGALAAGTLLLPDVAEAQRGGFRGGGGAGFRGGGGFGGVGGGGFRGGFAGRVGGFRGSAIGPGSGVRGGLVGARYGYGYRPGPVYGPGFGRYGFRGPGYGRAYAYRPYFRGYYGRRYPYYGGAVAAGLIGGLALGALSYPYYGYGYPYGYGEECWVRRRTIDQWGRVVVRLVQVCDY